MKRRKLLKREEKEGKKLFVVDMIMKQYIKKIL